MYDFYLVCFRCFYFCSNFISIFAFFFPQKSLNTENLLSDAILIETDNSMRVRMFAKEKEHQWEERVREHTYARKRA